MRYLVNKMSENKMVNVSQSCEEIQITIEITKFLKSTPTVEVLNNFVKFNCPPVYFESFLWGEVKEGESVCRLFKNQARIQLRKAQPGIWPEILLKVSRKDALQQKVALNDAVVAKTQHEERERSEKFDAAKKEKLQFQINREMSIHDKVNELNEKCLAVCISENKADKDKVSVKLVQGLRRDSIPAKPKPPIVVNNIRKAGKIEINFSGFKAPVPKRESQLDNSCSNNVAPNVTIYE